MFRFRVLFIIHLPLIPPDKDLFTVIKIVLKLEVAIKAEYVLKL